MSKLPTWSSILGAVATTVALVSVCNEAQAAVISGALVLPAPLQTIPEPPSGIDDVYDYALSATIPFGPFAWAPGEEGDVVLVDPGFTANQCRALIVASGGDPLRELPGIGSGCVSDVARLVNVANQAHIWFVSGTAAPADVVQIPSVVGPHRQVEMAVEKLPPLDGENFIFTQRDASNGRNYNLTFFSDYRFHAPGISDSFRVAASVPTLSTPGRAVLLMTLLGLGGLALALGRRRFVSLGV